MFLLYLFIYPIPPGHSIPSNPVFHTHYVGYWEAKAGRLWFGRGKKDYIEFILQKKKKKSFYYVYEPSC